MQINLVSRESVLAANPVLARALYDWQSMCFDPLQDPYFAGQEVWDSDTDRELTLTEAKAAEWNAEFEAFCAAQSDRFDPVPPALPKAGFAVAEYLSPSFDAFAGSIAAPTRRLFGCLGWAQVTMIGASRTPYLEQINDAPGVVDAEQRLLKAGLTRDYCGAISADPENAAQFLAKYFWLARCNAAAPNLYVTAPGATVLLLPCKYGNYHAETYSDTPTIEALLHKSGFTLAPDGICEERFSETGAIPGRRLPI